MSVVNWKNLFRYYGIIRAEVNCSNKILGYFKYAVPVLDSGSS